MLVVKSKRYIKKYRVGGAGIFNTLSGYIGRLLASNAAKTEAANLSKAAASDIGKSAVNAGKTVAKELGNQPLLKKENNLFLLSRLLRRGVKIYLRI